MIVISQLELDARTKISDFRDTFLAKADAPLFSTTQSVLNAWAAMWSSSMPATQVLAVAQAMNNVTLTQENVNTVLTTLVRAKVLRSRVQGGVRRYEVTL